MQAILLHPMWKGGVQLQLLSYECAGNPNQSLGYIVNRGRSTVFTSGVHCEQRKEHRIYVIQNTYSEFNSHHRSLCLIGQSDAHPYSLPKDGKIGIISCLANQLYLRLLRRGEIPERTPVVDLSPLEGADLLLDKITMVYETDIALAPQ